MLTEAQQRTVTELESKHPRFMVWVDNTVTGGVTYCARMWDEHGPGMRTLINNGSPDDLDQQMSRLEGEIPRLASPPQTRPVSPPAGGAAIALDRTAQSNWTAQQCRPDQVARNVRFCGRP